MVFGFFFKKKKAPEDSSTSGRQRRMIQSQRIQVTKPPSAPMPQVPAQPQTPAERRVSGPQRAVAPAAGKPPSGPAKAVSGPVKAAVTPAAAPRADVGQLKRGESGALKAPVDTEQADIALRDFLLEGGMGEPAKVNEAFERKSATSPYIKLLVEEKIVNESDLLVELSKKCMIPQGKLAKYRIRKKALECLAPEMAIKTFMLPVDKLGQILSVAMVNPLNKEAVKTIGALTGLRIKTVVCTYSEFMEQYNKHYMSGGEVTGSEETLDISIEEAQPISPDEFKKSISGAMAAKPAAPAKPAPSPASTAKLTTPGRPVPAVGARPAPAPAKPAPAEPLELEIIPSVEPEIELVQPNTVEEVKGEEVIPLETTTVLSAETVVAPVEEEPLLEPIIEGISLAVEEGEEQQPAIEPIIITAQDREEVLPAAMDEEYIDAVQVVEEEFHQGITLGAVDLFKKWENLHRKNRILTLKSVPEDVYAFLTAGEP